MKLCTLVIALGLMRSALGMSPMVWRHSPPIVVGERVVFSDPEGETVICLDRESGRRLWKTKAPGGQAQLVANDGRLYLGAKGGIYEVDSEKGKLRRLARAEFPRVKLLRVDEDFILLQSHAEKEFDPTTWSIDRRTGKRRWRCEEADFILAIGKDVLFFSTDPFTKKGGAVGGLDLRDGKILWSEPSDSSALEGGAVGEYFLGDANDEHFSKIYNQRTGESQSQRMPEGAFMMREDVDDDASTIEFTEWSGDERPKTIVRSYRVPEMEGKTLAELEGRVWPLLVRGGLVVWRKIPGPNEKERRFICAQEIASKKTLWTGDWSNSAWLGVHDGWIYPSVTEADWTSTVNAIELKTGARKVLVRSKPAPWSKEPDMRR